MGTEVTATAALVALLGVIGAVGRYLAKKFFDDEKGYFSRLVAKHLSLIDRLMDRLEALKERDEQQAELCKEHKDALEGTSKDISSIKEAGLEACRLCREVMVDPSESATARLDNIERVLTERQG